MLFSALRTSIFQTRWNVKLAIVLTKAAPAFFYKIEWRKPPEMTVYWKELFIFQTFLFDRFGYLNKSGIFHIKIET